MEAVPATPSGAVSPTLNRCPTLVILCPTLLRLELTFFILELKSLRSADTFTSNSVDAIFL